MLASRGLLNRGPLKGGISMLEPSGSNGIMTRGIMTRRRASVVSLGLALAGLLSLAAAASGGRDKALAEVKDFTDRFNRAYEANDMKAYWPFYADDMSQYWEEGRLDIEDYKKYWAKQLADGTKILEVKTEDPVFHISPGNDAAVAAYRIYTKMLRPDGTTTASWHQETDVLFKRNGRWQVVHLHDSPAPAEK
jgi:ketosteroid isomerase-like protein